MFVIELINGIRANSLALTGDSLDMLGDSLVYGSSLLVVYKSQKAQARLSLLTGFIMIGSALNCANSWSISISYLVNTCSTNDDEYRNYCSSSEFVLPYISYET